MDNTHKINTKTIARLAAIQVFYALEIMPKTSIKILISDLANYYSDSVKVNKDIDLASDVTISYHKSFFNLLISHSIDNLSTISLIISEHLKPPYDLKNTNILLLAILKVALAELLCITETPIKVVINEFTNIAGSFLSGNDVAFVNALLDSHAKIISNDRLLVNAL